MTPLEQIVFGVGLFYIGLGALAIAAGLWHLAHGKLRQAVCRTCDRAADHMHEHDLAAEVTSRIEHEFAVIEAFGEFAPDALRIEQLPEARP